MLGGATTPGMADSGRRPGRLRNTAGRKIAGDSNRLRNSW
jgi:hypothetical protein